MNDNPASIPSDPVLGRDLGHFLQQPWVHHTLASLVALLIAWVVWRVLLRSLKEICRRTRFAELEPLILKVARWSYWFLAMLFVLQQAGVNTESLWTTITATAALVAVGFIAVWSVLSNLVASFLIIGARLFRPRDAIEMLDVGGGSVRGEVHAVDLLFTRIEERHPDGRTTMLKIPNNLFFQKVVRVRPPDAADGPAANDAMTATDRAERGPDRSVPASPPPGVMPDGGAVHPA